MKRRGMLRNRVLKRIHVLPTLMTLGNLLCGFAGISLAICAMASQGGQPFEIAGKSGDELLLWACVALFVGMVFDMLDGRIARMTHTTSAFGVEIDSLADVVAFGVAPAAIVGALALSLKLEGAPVSSRATATGPSRTSPTSRRRRSTAAEWV